MNEFSHCAAALWLAVLLGYNDDLLMQAWIIWCTAGLLDIDGMAAPFDGHGEFFHTYLGGFISLTIFAIPTYLFLRNASKRRPITLFLLSRTGFCCITMHLLLDVFTWAKVDQMLTHKYFLPVWQQQFHLNRLFPSIPRWCRVLSEILGLIMFLTPLTWRYLRCVPAPVPTRAIARPSEVDFETENDDEGDLFVPTDEEKATVSYQPSGRISQQSTSSQRCLGHLCENFRNIFRKAPSYQRLSDRERLFAVGLLSVQAFVIVNVECFDTLTAIYHVTGFQGRLAGTPPPPTP